MLIRPRFAREPNIAKYNDAINDTKPSCEDTCEPVHLGGNAGLDGSRSDEVVKVPSCNDACRDEEVVGAIERECGCCCCERSDRYDEGHKTEAWGVFPAAVIESGQLDPGHSILWFRFKTVTWVQYSCM
jgi:hypothetical protein